MMECAWCGQPIMLMAAHITIVEHDEDGMSEEYEICSSQCLRKWVE